MTVRSGRGFAAISSSLTGSLKQTFVGGTTAVLAADSSLVASTAQAWQSTAVLAGAANLLANPDLPAARLSEAFYPTPQWKWYSEAFVINQGQLEGTKWQATAILSASSSMVAAPTLSQLQPMAQQWAKTTVWNWFTDRSITIPGFLPNVQIWQATAVLSASSSVIANPISTGGATAWQATAVLAGGASLLADASQLVVAPRKAIVGRPRWKWFDHAFVINQGFNSTTGGTAWQATAVLSASSSLIADTSAVSALQLLGQESLRTPKWKWFTDATVVNQAFPSAGAAGTVWQATAVLSASGSLAAAGDQLITLTRPILDVSSSHRWTWFSRRSITQRSTLANTFQATAVLAASSSLSGFATVPGQASLVQATAVLAGAGSLIAQTVQRLQAVAVLSASSSLIATPIQNMMARAVLAGSGSLIANILRFSPVTAVLAGAGSLQANISRYSPTSAILVANSSLIANITRYVPATAVLAGAGSLSAVGTMLAQARATMVANGSLLAAGQLPNDIFATMRASSALIANTLWFAAGFATLQANSALLANAVRFSPTGVVLAGSGSLIAQTRQVLAAYAGLMAQGAMIAAPVHNAQIRATMAGSGSLRANAFIHRVTPTKASQTDSLILSQSVNAVSPPLIQLGH